MILEAKYPFGMILYLKTDKDQLPRILTQICFTKNECSYQLSSGNASSWHYEFEIAVEKSVLETTIN